jgi:hypothetical protein
LLFTIGITVRIRGDIYYNIFLVLLLSKMSRVVKRNNNNKLERRKDQLETMVLKAREFAMSAPPTPLRFGTCLRYVQSAAGTSTVKWVSMFALFGVCTTTTNFQGIIEAVKVNSVSFYIPGAIQTSATSFQPPTLVISIRDSGVIGAGVEKERTLTAVDSAGAFWKYKPRGVAAQWLTDDATRENTGSGATWINLISTGCRAFVELDVSVQLIATTTAAGAASLSQGATVDTTTAGAFVALPLDSLTDTNTEGSQLLVPQGLATATVNLPVPVGKVQSAVMSSSSTACGCCTHH